MVFNLCLYTSLAVFGIGTLYKAVVWITRNVGPVPEGVTALNRLFSATGGIIATLFSAKILTLLKILVLDVVLQLRILKDNPLRWAMHILLYGGFMLLLFMHALEAIVSENLFDGYYNTLNPFFFLRDLFGTMVILGIAIALYRRFVANPPRFKTDAMDVYAVAILAVIMGSGLLLEGAKLTSHTEFMSYAEEYADVEEEEE